MKVLFVSPWLPGALRPRSLGLLDIIARRHEVRVLALARSDEEADSATALTGFQTTFVHSGRRACVTRCGRALVRGASLQTAYADVPEWRRQVRAIVQEWGPDIVHLNVFRSAHLVDDCGRSAVVIDLDEFRSDYYDQLKSARRAHQRLLGRWEQPRMSASEGGLVQRGIEVMVSGDPPARYAQAPSVHVVRTPVDRSPISRSSSTDPAAPRVLFVGRMTYEANVEGVLDFIGEVWPGVRARMPGATLQVVGSKPPRTVTRWHGHAGIEIHADVSSVDGYYARASMSVAPITRATGIQMKLIQASAAGVPSVISPLVASLAGVSDREGVLVAAGAASWTRAIEELATDPALRASIGAASVNWFQANHSVNAVASKLEAVYRSALSGRPAGD